METPEQEVVDAVLYAMRCGCFFPVPEPPRGADVDTWIKWGAMRHLHDVVAKLPPAPAAQGKAE